jgi:MFS family permease
VLPWSVVGALWVTLAIASGLYFSFPIFYVALLAEFGWSRGATAAAFSISSVVQGMLSPVVGMLVDRFGPRRVMLGGACLLGCSCVLGGQIGSLWTLYVVTGVLGAAGVCAVSWIPSGALIARWFTERRGSMMGLAFSGMGVGLLVIGPLSQWLIVGYGWRAAYVVLGLGTLIVLLPLIGLGVREPSATAFPRRSDVSRSEPEGVPAAGAERVSDADARPTSAGWNVADALRTRAFWALFFAYLCTPLAVFSVVTHQVAFAVDHGFAALFVSGIFGLTGLLSTVGRIVFGFAADWIGRATSATVSYGCTALGTLCLLSLDVWPQAAALYAYAFFFGLGFGARGPIITAMASQLFPGRRFGAIYGILSVGNGIGGGIAPWFGGVVHDLTGSYRVAFLIAVSFCAVGSACFWLARPPAGTRDPRR